MSGVWTDVLTNKSDATVFDTVEWQSEWWRHFGDGAQLMLVRAGDEGAVGLAPLMKKNRIVSFLGGTDLVDYHDFITTGDPGKRFYEDVLESVRLSGGVKALNLYSIPEGSPALRHLPSAAEENGWCVDVKKEDVAPRLELPDTWEEYLAGLSKKRRHELRRKRRRLERAGDVRSEELSDAGHIEQNLTEFLSLMRSSSPAKDAFMTPARERFFRSITVSMAAQDATRLSFLNLDGHRVAASLAFIYNGCKLVYNSGYEPNQRNLAVGLLDHAYNIERSIEQGLDVYDFMRGGETYKYHLGGQDRIIYTLTVYPNEDSQG